MSWDRDAVMQEIAEDKYKGYELDAAKQLFRRLPTGHESLADVVAWMRYYALEATQKYNPDDARGAKFTTFLYRHWRVRSLQWFNWAWLPKNQPTGKYVGCFSQMSTDADGESIESRLEDPHPPGADIRAKLSPAAQQLYDKLLSDDVVDASLEETKLWSRDSLTLLSTPDPEAEFVQRFKAILARRLCMPVEEIDQLVVEIRTSAGQFISLPI